MEILGWLAIGLFTGIGLTLAIVALIDEVRLAPPADANALPSDFRQAWKT